MAETSFKGPVLSLIENEIKNWVKHYIACSNLLISKLGGSHVNVFPLESGGGGAESSICAGEGMGRMAVRKEMWQLREHLRLTHLDGMKLPGYTTMKCVWSVWNFVRFRMCKAKKERRKSLFDLSKQMYHRCSPPDILPLLQQHLGRVLLSAEETFHHFQPFCYTSNRRKDTCQKKKK